LTVGSAASMRAASATSPPAKGTLRSSLTSTFLPANSALSTPAMFFLRMPVSRAIIWMRSPRMRSTSAAACSGDMARVTVSRILWVLMKLSDSGTAPL
jgi:hypothetical protein